MGQCQAHTTCCEMLQDVGNFNCPVSCRRYITEGAAHGSVEHKMNQLVNYFCGIRNAEELIHYIIYGAGGTFSQVYPNWALAYILIFPPVVENVPILFPGVQRQTGRLADTEYHTLPNPFLAQARIMENLLNGSQSLGSFPCLNTYNVPYYISSRASSVNRGVEVTFWNVVNPGFDSCFNFMQRRLVERQPDSGECIGGKHNNVYLSGTQGYDVDKVRHHLHQDELIAARLNRTNLTLADSSIGEFLTNATETLALAMFFSNTEVGPYDTTTKKPCTDATSSTCTFQMCQGRPALGYNCHSSGVCQPVYEGQAVYSTLEECEDCYKFGSCVPEGNVCCPDSVKVDGACPPSTPGVTPNTNVTTELLIIAAVIILLVVVYIMYRRRK